jgi:predicted nucleotidyltransferase
MGHIIVVMMKRLPIEPSKLAAFCEANGIRKLSLFGSQLHGTSRPDSDIDLLVEFYPDQIPSFFEVARMEHEISEMLEGREIDLKTPMSLSPHFRKQVMEEALLQYGN